VVYNNTLEAGVLDNTVFATSVLQLMTLEYRLFQELPLDMCGQYISIVNVPQEQEQTAAQLGHERRLDDQGDGDAADADEANNGDEDGADGADDSDGADEDSGGNDSAANDESVEVECPANGLYSFQVEYTLPAADEKSAWLATGWTGTGYVVLYSEMDNKDSMVGYCQLKLGTSVTPSTERQFNPPSALVASLAAIAVVAALFLLCIYCTCCRTYKRPPRNKEYLERDPIEIDRSRSGEMDYQSLGDTKPWTSTGSKSADVGLIA
jgi:hypothetical protein